MILISQSLLGMDIKQGPVHCSVAGFRILSLNNNILKPKLLLPKNNKGTQGTFVHGYKEDKHWSACHMCGQIIERGINRSERQHVERSSSSSSSSKRQMPCFFFPFASAIFFKIIDHCSDDWN